VTSVAAATHPADHETVEELVRAQLSAALGGRRGMLEGAIPTIAFTLTWVLAHDLRLALTVSLALAVAALLLRVVQRQPTRFVLNALIGIGIGAFIASRTGEAKDVFLPGILTNAGYAVAMLASVVLRWPLMGFLLGSVTGDPTSWREDAGIVRLCSRLTLVLAVPCVLRVLVQLPLYLADETAWLGASKVALGWPLQVVALGAMVWVLNRDQTPFAGTVTTPPPATSGS
jgi:hypothetical protein